MRSQPTVPARILGLQLPVLPGDAPPEIGGKFGREEACRVLIIACPHALGLAIPLVIAISTSLGAQNGLLVKDRLALERARNLDMVIFDKTGTLTRGSPALSGVAAAPGSNENDLLALAAAVEANSEHPLAKAVVAEAQRRNLPALQATDFEALPGRGAQARVNGKSVILGGTRLLTEGKLAVPPEVEKVTTQWASEGKTGSLCRRRRETARCFRRRG
jgi:P-type Cu2+ transporter